MEKNKNLKEIVIKVEGEKWEKALDKALDYRINLNKNGGPRIITKTNKTLIDLDTFLNIEKNKKITL